MYQIVVNVDWLNNYGASTDVLPIVVADKDLDELKAGFVESFHLHVQSMIDDNEELPEDLKGEYEFKFVLTTRALLHYYDGIITRAAISRITGINEKQLGHYMQGVRSPRKEQRERIISGLRKLGKELESVE